MMSSIIVDHLLRTFPTGTNTGIAYIYCNYQPGLEQNIQDFLLCVLRQLVQPLATIPQEIQILYKHHAAEHKRPTQRETTRLLESTIPLYSKVFLIVDALDEYHLSGHERQKLLVEKIFGLQKRTQLSFLATSRPNLEIEAQFKGYLQREIRAHESDIVSFVDGQIPRLLRSQISTHPAFADLQQMAKAAIADAVDGM